MLEFAAKAFLGLVIVTLLAVVFAGATREK